MTSGTSNIKGVIKQPITLLKNKNFICYSHRFCGYFPFRSRNDDDSLYDIIKKGDIDFTDETWNEVSDEGLFMCSLFIISNMFFVMSRLCGNPPFQAKDEETLYELIKQGYVEFTPDKIWNQVSAQGLSSTKDVKFHLIDFYKSVII
jgi:hypothetical protein